MSVLLKRMIRAAMLDRSLYEEVETDRGALGQAISVVLMASVAGGIGGGGLAGVVGIVAGSITALFVWFFWALSTYLIGARLLAEPQTRADLGELLRTIGFASAPGILRVLGLVPGLTSKVFLLTGLWMLAAMVVAVRQALDYQSTWRAIVVCLIGWVVEVFVMLLFVWIAVSAGTAGLS